eukprot:scaffold139232_cov136-Phaeocystis_antarctica.AAC.2
MLLLEAQGFASGTLGFANVVELNAQQCEDTIAMNVIDNCKESCNEFVLDSSTAGPVIQICPGERACPESMPSARPDSCLLARALLPLPPEQTQFGSSFGPSKLKLGSACEEAHPGNCEPLKPGMNYLAGDKNEAILLTVTDNTGSETQTVIELQTAPSITWWHGICNNKWEIMATSGDNHGPKTTTITLEETEGAAFYKAGFLGVHTWRHIFAVEGGFQKDKKYSFYWAKSD